MTEPSAYARQIAAAPDLLKALKQIVLDYQDVPDATDATGQAVFNDARAAIAKAEVASATPVPDDRPYWDAGEVAELLDSLARSADRLETSYSETAHIAREGSVTIRRLLEAVETLIDGTGGHQHWDPKGTSGANCPICALQFEAKTKARELCGHR